jgi:hypothetical protein
MKKWKVMLFAGAAGLLMMAMGAVMGADTGGIFIGYHNNSFTGFNFFNDDGVFIKTTEKDSLPFTEIYVSVTNLEVRLFESSSFGYDFNRRDERNITIGVADGILTVSERGSVNVNLFSLGPFLGLFSTERGHTEYLDIYVPPNTALDTVRIQITSGGAAIDGITCNDLAVRLSSGSTDVNNVTVNSLSLHSTSGAISIHNTDAAEVFINVTSGNITASNLHSGGMTARTISGNISMEGTFLAETDIKVTSGNVTLNLNGSEQQYNIKTFSTSGRVRVNGERRSTGTVMRSSADNTLLLQTVSGNVNVNFMHKQ